MKKKKIYLIISIVIVIVMFTLLGVKLVSIIKQQIIDYYRRPVDYEYTEWISTEPYIIMEMKSDWDTYSTQCCVEHELDGDKNKASIGYRGRGRTISWRIEDEEGCTEHIFSGEGDCTETEYIMKPSGMYEEYDEIIFKRYDIDVMKEFDNGKYGIRRHNDGYGGFYYRLADMNRLTDEGWMDEYIFEDIVCGDLKNYKEVDGKLYLIFEITEDTHFEYDAEEGLYYTKINYDSDKIIQSMDLGEFSDEDKKVFAEIQTQEIIFE